MGGCCSKLNISGPGASSKGLETDVDKTRTGDTPKLSRLQHKESFSNGHVKPSDHSNVTSNGGGPGATPSLAGATQQRKTENGHSNGNGNIKSPDEPELLENDKALGNTNNTSAENNVTSVSVVEKPQVSKVTLGDAEIKAVAENGVTLIQSNEETSNSLVSTSESTTVSVTQSVAKEESKESSEKTVVMIKNETEESSNTVEESLVSSVTEVEKVTQSAVQSSSMSQEVSSSVQEFSTSQIQESVSSQETSSRVVESSSVVTESSSSVEQSSAIESSSTEMSSSSTSRQIESESKVSESCEVVEQ